MTFFKQYIDMEIVTVGLVTAIVQALKTSFNFRGQYSFIVSIATGIILYLLHDVFIDSINFQTIVNGLITGLSASGLYSGSKSIVKERHY